MIELAGQVFTLVTAGDHDGIRAVQAVLESDPATYALLEGAPPRADEAALLVEETPPGVPPERKQVWVSETCVIDLVSGYPDAATWYLGLLFLAPHARNGGLGTRLVHAIVDFVRARGGHALRLAVVSTNVGARRLYDRLGFTHVARRQRQTSGLQQDVDVLELRFQAS